MASNFSALKKSRSKAFDKLNEQISKLSTKQSFGDDEYWKLDRDKAGNGYAVIRFLPAPEGEDMPFVRMWDHGFQGPTGQWYIENSLTTIGKDDPVSEFNSKLWNSGIEADKEQARRQKRRLSYHANIYVIKDSANPSNEGKVFKYKFGKKIFDKLNDLMNPEFEDESPVNPFDFWEGADFKLKVREVEGWANYDKSEFDTPGPLKSSKGAELSDEELEQIWKQQYSLQEIIDPKNFKSYDELKAKLDRVLGLSGDDTSPAKGSTRDDEEMDYRPNFKERSRKEEEARPSPQDSADEDDIDLDFFKGLADDDD